MNAEIARICEWVASGVANGVWQGLVLACAVGIGVRLLNFRGRMNAAARYAIFYFTLLALAALPVAHLVLDPGSPFRESAREFGKTKEARAEMPDRPLSEALLFEPSSPIETSHALETPGVAPHPNPHPTKPRGGITGGPRQKER
jgi:hypothetical protein